MRTVPTSLPPRFQALRCRTTRLAERGRRARARGPCRSGQPRLPREAPSRTRFFVGTVGRNKHVLRLHIHTHSRKKVRPAKAPAATLQRERMRTNPPGFSRVSARTRMGGRSVTQRQIQLRSHDADGACPSRRRPGLSLGANTHELIHTSSSAIRPRGGDEAAHPFAHSPREATRSLRPSRAGCSTRSRWRPPRGLDGVGTPRVTSRRRHPPATVITHRSPRVSPVSPSLLPPSPSPQARHEAEVKKFCQSRASD